MTAEQMVSAAAHNAFFFMLVTVSVIAPTNQAGKRVELTG